MIIFAMSVLKSGLPKIMLMSDFVYDSGFSKGNCEHLKQLAFFQIGLSCG